MTFIFNILYNTTFTDVYSCYLLYKSELVDYKKLKTSGWEHHGEILSIAAKNGSKFYKFLYLMMEELLQMEKN